MTTFIFTKIAEKNFLRLPLNIQKRILVKLKEMKDHNDILSAVKRLVNVAPATHRMRIGTYRLVLELKSQEENHFEFWILDVGHRKDIYR